MHLYIFQMWLISCTSSCLLLFPIRHILLYYHIQNKNTCGTRATSFFSCTHNTIYHWCHVKKKGFYLQFWSFSVPHLNIRHLWLIKCRICFMTPRPDHLCMISKMFLAINVGTAGLFLHPWSHKLFEAAWLSPVNSEMLFYLVEPL